MNFYCITKNIDYVNLQNQVLSMWSDKLIVINPSDLDMENFCIQREITFYNIPVMDYGDGLNYIISNIIDNTTEYAIIAEGTFITQNIEFIRYETEIISQLLLHLGTPYMSPDLLLSEANVDFKDVDFSIEPFGIETNKKINQYTIDWVNVETQDDYTIYSLTNNIIGFRYNGNDINDVREFLKKLGL
jgi:hypothetical protein